MTHDHGPDQGSEHSPEAERIRAALQVLRAHDAKHAPTFEGSAHRPPVGRVLAWHKVAVPFAAAAALILVLVSQREPRSAAVVSSAAPPAASQAFAPMVAAVAPAPTPTLPLDFLLEDAAFGTLLSKVPTFDVTALSPKVRP